MALIPTTKEFFEKYSNLYQFEESSPEYLIDKECFQAAMIEFAKLHVTAALKEAAETSNGFTEHCPDFAIIEGGYELTNIK